MKTQIKMIVSDLDGTLLNGEHKISERTAQAVRLACRAGIRFAVATGRFWKTAFPLLEAAGIKAYMVLLNGAEFRSPSGSLVFQYTMRDRTAQLMVEYLLGQGLDVEVNTAAGDFSTNIRVCGTASEFPEFRAFWEGKPGVRKIFAFSQENPDMVRQVMGRLKQTEEARQAGETGAAGQAVREIRSEQAEQAVREERIGDWQRITVTSSAPWNVEITAVGVHKGAMVKRAAKQFGLSADEVLVFGDGENDSFMFSTFPHSRAMENAAPCILRQAEKVIESNIADGVAQEIERVLLRHGGL